MGEVIDFQDMQAQHKATLEKAKQQAENPPQREWGEIFPFRATELPSFPVETLPAWLRDYVKALSTEAQTPIDLAGCLALAVLSLCCAKRAVVGIRGRWREPLNLYTLVAMESGAGKSPVFRAMMEPVFAWEARTNQDRASEIEQVKQERDLLQQMQLKAKQDAVRAKDPLKRREAESELRENTERLQNTPLPNPVRYFVGDVTPERLAGLLEENGERIGILDSEGGIFETIAGRYSDKQIPNLDLILKGHEGGSVRIDRKNAPPLALHSPALTIGLTVQPSVLRGLAQKEGFRDRGLLGRFLYAVPPSKVGTRTFCTEGYSLSLEDCYHERVTALLSPSVPPFPMELSFTPSAFARFGTFWNEIENRFLPDNPL